MLTHYQTLEVSQYADLLAIKKAYHSISLLCHPDKTVHLPDEERAQREQLFKHANVAFEVLSNPKSAKTTIKPFVLDKVALRHRPATLQHVTRIVQHQGISRRG